MLKAADKTQVDC